MAETSRHLADLTGAQGYHAYLEFTGRIEPSVLADAPLPFPSLLTGIAANALTPEARSLREGYGRVPCSAPLYLWELQQGDAARLLYVGQTALQGVQERFERNGAVVRLLVKYVNDPSSRVHFRLCSRPDVAYESEDSQRKPGNATRANSYHPDSWCIGGCTGRGCVANQSSWDKRGDGRSVHY